jgi:hypothetical protein
MSDRSLNMLHGHIFTELQMNLLLTTGAYKSTSCRKSIYTPTSQTMGSKELEPWSPRWVRWKLREMNNGLPLNDPNYDEKPPADTKRLLCKCDLDCQFHMSIDYDTYGKRYWSCPLPTSQFNCGWDEEKPRKVLSILTFIVHILNNVVMNCFIILNGVCVELFPPPPEPPGCDFK